MARSLCCSVVVVLAFSLSVPAQAHESVSGGALAPDRPKIEQLRCDTGETQRCPRGEMLELQGEFLDTGRSVTFLGGKGRRDNRRSTPQDATPHSLVVRVPTSARTGPVRVLSAVAGKSTRSARLEVLAPSDAAPGVKLTATSTEDGVFPVGGRYDFGTQTNRFGGGRNHQGQDILAACGLRVLAAKAGTVALSRYQAAAGNYVVVQATDGTSQVYMHLREAAMVSRGDRVAAGQQLGVVGTTGRSSACHLHFELWTAPGWYQGGEAIDPLPELRRWASV
jgi:murein DD-endopeptidase MepM/ murein hydrolase activator NlpD